MGDLIAQGKQPDLRAKVLSLSRSFIYREGIIQQRGPFPYEVNNKDENSLFVMRKKVLNKI